MIPRSATVIRFPGNPPHQPAQSSTARLVNRNRSAQAEPNRLLASLPAETYYRLLPHMEPVQLEAKQVLAAPDEPIRYVYFLVDGVASLLVLMEDGTTIEGATIGNEGIVGLAVFLGDGISDEEMVQVLPGRALRVRAAVFRDFIATNPALATLLQRYTLALMNQLARTAGCNRLHTVEERCARWLLMSRDRVGKDSFPLTHDALAGVLGIRRASVTEAVGVLQQAGMVECRRGWIAVRDADALETVACEDYQLCKEAYERVC